MKQTEKSNNRIGVIRFQQLKKSYITGIKKSPRRRIDVLETQFRPTFNIFQLSKLKSDEKRLFQNTKNIKNRVYLLH